MFVYTLQFMLSVCLQIKLVFKIAFTVFVYCLFTVCLFTDCLVDINVYSLFTVYVHRFSVHVYCLYSVCLVDINVYCLFTVDNVFCICLLFLCLFQVSECFSVMDSSSPEFDVYGAMEWKDGVGSLPGSQLKVCAQDS